MKHVIALSGGKDSTAMALRLTEIEPKDYEYRKRGEGCRFCSM